MIEPTVGRVVWFYEFRPETGEHVGPFKADVVHVHSDSVVNLYVVNHQGVASAALSVPLLQDGDPVPGTDYCCWMPYQKGQAAKLEQVEQAARRGFRSDR